jgi:ribonucleoside-diphosphate reductase alpha chain
MEKVKRPKNLESITVKERTGCGNLYVTLTYHDSKVLEVFAHLGKSGGCAACQNEGMTRAISLGLRYGIPIEDYTKGLKGIQCPNPYMHPQEERVLSCPDAIAKVMEEYGHKGKEVKLGC